MNAYNLAILFFSYCMFFIGILVLLKRNDFTGRSFFIYSFLCTGWGIGFAILVSDVSNSTALIAARACNMFALFIPPTWLQFVFAYLGIAEQKRKVARFVFLYSLSLLCFTPFALFVSGVIPIVGFSHYTDAGPLYHFFTIEFAVVVSYGFYELFKGLSSQSGIRKNQTVAFIIASLFGFSGGSLTFLPVYHIPFPQYGVFIMPLYPFIMAYAMMKQGLLDSEEALAIHRDKLALLGLMSSSINHEIKNPLFIIKELAHKAENNLQTNVNPQQALEAVGKMSGQITRITDIVNRFNDFVKPTKINSPVDVKQAIDNALFFASQELRYHDIEIKMNAGSDLAKLHGDKNQYEEIFLNLIINAYHAMPKGGVLNIETGQNNGSVTISISDTGTGIPQDRLKDIFKPFYTTKEKTGTGLGLHIVKTLVEQNGGKISVDSEVGEGTKFTLKFPVTIGVET